ncbi:hypothetical protein [Micromonospora avicenniae]|nr:hypothetical protein [Micromonospora avicenniae]
MVSERRRSGSRNHLGRLSREERSRRSGDVEGDIEELSAPAGVAGGPTGRHAGHALIVAGVEGGAVGVNQRWHNREVAMPAWLRQETTGAVGGSGRPLQTAIEVIPQAANEVITNICGMPDYRR